MQFSLPDLGEGIVDAELVEWRVRPGDAVEHGQTLVEVITDKAALEIPSPFAGKIARLLVEPGQHVKVHAPMLEYEAAAEAEPAESAPAVISQPPPTLPARTPMAEKKRGNGHPCQSQPPVKAAPSVRRMARQLGIDLAQVHGSGPKNRILIDDLMTVVQQSQVQQSQRPGASTERTATRETSPHDDFQPGTRVKLRGLRRKVAERMVEAKQTIPHYSLVDECDVTELVRLRESLKSHFAESGVKLTYLPFFVKALVSGLKEVPLANASLDTDAAEIVLHDRYHIGIACDTPDGLLVPVLRDADRKNLSEIAAEIEHLTEAARAKKLAADDLRGSTFTITSIGSIGGLISTPIINSPEVGILGIGRIVSRPIFDDTGNVRRSEIVYLSYSFDHRVLDGAIATRFSNSIIRSLQNPALLLLSDNRSHYAPRL
jgi:pyruvate/2-oxoglutarate dehydrogenase complex dihydrolipoamide acyltransferase (E2) component